MNTPINDIALKVSLMDSVCEKVFKAEPENTLFLNGTSEEKMKWRTNIIYSEARKLLGTTSKKKILNVGVVGNIIKKFASEGFEVTGTDYDERLVGIKLYNNSEIFHGSKTLELIAQSDLAVVTGMTITTGTIDDIIRCCKENNTKLIIFAETGANFGEYFISKGVDCYISEVFPFYIFNGGSTIKVYSK